MRVVEVDAAATLDLRRRVLRGHLPGAAAEYEEDALPATVHLGVQDGDGTLVAAATVFPQPTDHRPGARAARLRGMAVDPAVQGRGIGSRLLEALVERCRGDGYEVVWANGRDAALGFYRRHGWQVLGEGFASIGLPHHVVLLDL